MIVWVASFPRSGNNLCSRQTLRAVFRAKTGAVQNLDSLVSMLSLAEDADPIAAIRDHRATIFLKTHRVVDAADPSPAIYLVRDGRDSLVSYAHFAKAQGEAWARSASFEEALATLIEREDHPYGSWSDSVRAWTSRDASTAVIRFEELIVDPVATVRAAAESLGVRLRKPVGELPDFERLRGEDPGLYRRGKVGSWRSEMPAHLEQRFWELHGAEMEALGYSRE